MWSRAELRCRRDGMRTYTITDTITTDAEPDTTTDSEPDTSTDAKPHTSTNTQPHTNADAQSDGQPDPQPDTQPDPQTDGSRTADVPCRFELSVREMGRHVFHQQ